MSKKGKVYILPLPTVHQAQRHPRVCLDGSWWQTRAAVPEASSRQLGTLHGLGWERQCLPHTRGHLLWDQHTQDQAPRSCQKATGEVGTAKS